MSEKLFKITMIKCKMLDSTFKITVTKMPKYLLGKLANVSTVGNFLRIKNKLLIQKGEPNGYTKCKTKNNPLHGFYNRDNKSNNQ